MRRAHEITLGVAMASLATLPFLYYGGFCPLVVGAISCLLSFLLGIAVVREQKAAGAVTVRTRLTFAAAAFGVSLAPAGLLVEAAEINNSPRIIATTAAAVALAICLRPLGLVARRPVAWAIVAAVFLAAIGQWLVHPQALFGAIHRGYALPTRLLLAAGQDTNQLDRPDSSGTRPLAVAVAFHRPEIVELLLAHGADLNAVDNTMSTALEVAGMVGDFAMMQRLHGAGAKLRGASTLRNAVVGRNLEAIKWLLQKNPTLCADEPKGVLKAAAETQDRAIIDLIEASCR